MRRNYVDPITSLGEDNSIHIFWANIQLYAVTIPAPFIFCMCDLIKEKKNHAKLTKNESNVNDSDSRRGNGWMELILFRSAHQMIVFLFNYMIHFLLFFPMYFHEIYLLLKTYCLYLI